MKEIKKGESWRKGYMSGYADAIVKVWDIIEQYIAEEANIARSENQPTSRLTSLYMKLSNYLKQLNK